MTQAAGRDGIHQAGAVLRIEHDRRVVAHYGDVAAEFTALLTGAALVEGTSHGRWRITGADSRAFLHNVTTQDISGLPAGAVTWAVVSNWKGTVVDLVEVAADGSGLTVVTQPANRDRTAAWLNKYIITEDVALESLTDTTTQIEILGPAAARLLAGIVPALPEMGEMVAVQVAGVPVSLWQHRWIGGAGFRLLCDNGRAQDVWEALLAAGGVPAGAEALEWRRIMDGVPAYGAEMDEGTNPWEARLDRAVSLDKGCYLGQEVVARLRTYQKVQRYLVGLSLPPDGVPTAGEPILDGEGNPIGQVTSVAARPHGDALVLGLIKAKWAAAGTSVCVGSGSATVIDRPFWQT